MKKKTKIDWEIIHKDITKEGIMRSFLARREYSLGKDNHSATSYDNFMALSIAIRDRIIERWIATQQKYHNENVKRVYYLSMEFLIGRLMGTNILNLGIWDQVNEAMEDLGISLEDLRECETDAGLGNGGLGRLAACFLDSMATLGIPAQGYGIRYDYGIFNQKIINGYQVERPEKWLSKEYPWEFSRLEYTQKISFYGRTETVKKEDGTESVKWIDTEDVLAVPYDIPISGYKNDTVNTLRLWSARSTEDFDLQYFNDGDYQKAISRKVISESISKVLYPNDNTRKGQELRIKQEHFFTAASLADIIRRFKAENNNFCNLPNKAAIQLNDTHPALAIPELMRILVDQENIDWDTAWNIVINTFAYTNHTVMPEALEKWPVALLESMLPRHMQIIYEINRRFLEEIPKTFSKSQRRIQRMSLIEGRNNKMVRMAFLCIVGSHSVNGVSKLHTEILKTKIFKDFYDFYSDKFNSKTNGITQRRWLYKSNTALSKLIIDTIGDGWIRDAYKLKNLNNFKDNDLFCDNWMKVKKKNKENFADYVYKNTGIKLNTDSIFDVQIKRMHEYKRQLLFTLFIIKQYLKIKNNPNGSDFIPRTFIISGKAAPGYFMAKLIIKFINSVAEIINKDSEIGDKLKLIFLENYRVSLAEKIFSASDLSEQISCAGREASGTGCMKFMMNGALTIGTFDGANIEIAEAVGEDNIFIFGLKENQIQQLIDRGYNPKDYIQNSQTLVQIVELMKNNFFSPFEKGIFDPIIDNLLNHDPYFICADFEDYCRTQQMVEQKYRDKRSWTESSIINVAKSGKFSSDKTIAEYARQIWGIPIQSNNQQ